MGCWFSCGVQLVCSQGREPGSEAQTKQVKHASESSKLLQVTYSLPNDDVIHSACATDDSTLLLLISFLAYPSFSRTQRSFFVFDSFRLRLPCFFLLLLLPPPPSLTFGGAFL